MILLFDIDGTLILSGGAGRRAMNQAFFEVLGVEDALAGVRLHGATDPLIFERALGRPPAEEESRSVFSVYFQRLAEELDRTKEAYRVMPGVEFLLDLGRRRGWALGLATGNAEEGARIKLEAGGLWDRFAFGGYGSDSGDRAQLVRCGAERGIAWAREHQGRTLGRDAVVVLGDTGRDVEAAQAAGVRSVGVLAGSSHHDELAASSPDLIVQQLDAPELVRYLDG